MFRSRMKIRACALVAACAMVAASCGSDEGESATTEPPASSTGGGAASGTPTGAATSEAGGAEPPGAADDSLEPVRVGFVTMTQGNITYPDTVAGIEGAAAYVNAELGGIDGHPVEIEVCDVGVDEESNQKCGQQFANDESLTAVVTGLMFNAGPFYNALAASGTPVLGGVPLTNADYNAPNTVFYSSGSVVNKAVGIFARDYRPEWESIGVLVTEGDAGQLTVDFVREALEPAGVEVKSVVVPASTGDMAPLISSLGDVDAYFPGLSTAQCTQVALALELIAPDVPVVTVGACVNSQVWSQAPGSQEGWIVVTGDRSLEMGEGVSDDLDTFIEKFPEYGDEAERDRFTTVSWGSLLSLREVLNSVGYESFSPETIAEALAAFDGPVNMGVTTVQCPGEVYPAVCAADARAYEVIDETMVPMSDVEDISLLKG